MSSGLVRWLGIAALICSLSGATESRAEDPRAPDSLLTAAQAQADSWDFAAAIESYRRALELAPGDWRGRSGLVEALVDRGETLDSEASRAFYEEARRLAEALLADWPERPRSHYLHALASGQLALFLGGKDKVRLSRQIKDSLDRALELDPSDPEAWTVRGVYYYELATLGKALRFFARILYGGVPAGSLADATGDLEHALQLDPPSIAAHYHLARTLHKLKDYEGALAHCEAIRVLPDKDHENAKHRLDAAELEKKIRKRLRVRQERRQG